MFSTDPSFMRIDVKGRLDEGGYKPDWHVTVDEQTVTIVDRRDLENGFRVSVLLPVAVSGSSTEIFYDQINCRHPTAAKDPFVEGRYDVDEEGLCLRLDARKLDAFWLVVRGYYV